MCSLTYEIYNRQKTMYVMSVYSADLLSVGRVSISSRRYPRGYPAVSISQNLRIVKCRKVLFRFVAIDCRMFLSVPSNNFLQRFFNE